MDKEEDGFKIKFPYISGPVEIALVALMGLPLLCFILKEVMFPIYQYIFFGTTWASVTLSTVTAGIVLIAWFASFIIRRD